VKRCILLAVLCEYISDARAYECYKGYKQLRLSPSGNKLRFKSFNTSW